MKTDNLSIPPVQGQMDRHRWETVNRIFHAALELNSSSIENFVRSTSDGDTEIYAEVMALLRADEKAGSYLETPLLRENLSALFESPLKPEDVLCERFQILRAIAEGGMGHVFEALDTELNVRVALKVIRPEIASVPEALARFRQEVRLARTITHPNVCRTFDIDRETRVLEPETGSKLDLVFLTMELLPGETLASRIKRNGALPIEEAFLLACQIGDALHAAHALGIVHRDIKPSNIMLVPTESATADGKVRAVITDFGLARLNPVLPIANASSLSKTARPIGTLAYMAPEQLDGAPVSPATDVYAFGLILFEMVTGSRAFPSDNLLTGLSQRLTGPPPSPKALAPRLPDNWYYVIDRCLQVNPSERLQEASEVVTALAGNRRHRTSGHGHFLSSFPFLFSSFRRAFAVVVTTIFICLALFAAGYRLYQSKADSNVTPGALVYLAPVKNETGQKSLDNITELIRAGLAQSVHVNLLDQGRVGDILQQMTKSPDGPIDQVTGREIAMRARAARVVFTTVSQSGSNYRLNVDIQQPDTAPGRYRDHWQTSYEWHTVAEGPTSASIPPDLLNAVRMSSDWIRAKVGESNDDIARLNAPPEDVTTADWNALSAYATAEILVANGRREDAIISLQEAVQIDPAFSFAYARMGDLEMSLGSFEASYRAYDQALSSEFDRRLTRRERDRIRGIYASDSWDYQAAESSFRDYTVYYPNDEAGWFYRALPLVRLSRIDEAIESLKKAAALDGSRSRDPYDLALWYTQLGDFQSAGRWISELRKLNANEAVAHVEGLVAILNRRYDMANSSFLILRSSPLPRFRFRAFAFLSRLAMEQGDQLDALQWTNSGISEALKQGSKSQRAEFLIDRAYLRCHSFEYEPCLQDARQALDLDHSPALLIAASELYGEANSARTGAETAAIRAQLFSLPTMLSNETGNLAVQVAREHLQTEIYLASGNWNAALKESRKEAAIDLQFKRHAFLARTLVTVAHHSSSDMDRRSLLKEARQHYAVSALHPEVIWIESTLYPPGALSEDILAYLRVSKELGVEDGDTKQARDTLKSLRPN